MVPQPVPPFATPRMPLSRLVPIEVVATTEPFAFVESKALVMFPIAKLLVVALVSVTLPLNVLAPEYTLSVVVEKKVLKMPVEESYASGKVAESEDDEILLLNKLQSLLLRYPFVDPLACEIESVLPENESGPLTLALVMAPVPLPVNNPPSVVLPVPPTATPSVELETSDVPSYQMGRPAVKDDAPVPPPATPKMPLNVGVKVCVSLSERMGRPAVRPFQVNEDVASVCVPPVCAVEYCAPSALMPLPLVASVVPSKVRPLPTRSDFTAPVPLPRRIPLSVELPVPPFDTPSTPVSKLAPIEVVAMTLPAASVAKSAELVALSVRLPHTFVFTSWLVDDANTPFWYQAGVVVAFTVVAKFVATFHGHERPEAPVSVTSEPSTVNDEQETEPAHDAVPVATVPSVFALVQYARLPTTGALDVEMPLKVNAPVPLSYASGNVALSDELLILPLNKFQSEDER